MNVVVVESPAKAKTINKYLGSDFTVLASYGHVRDLPSKDGSVDPDSDFAMIWEADPKAQKRINDIAAAVKGPVIGGDDLLDHVHGIDLGLGVVIGGGERHACVLLGETGPGIKILCPSGECSHKR